MASADENCDSIGEVEDGSIEEVEGGSIEEVEDGSIDEVEDSSEVQQTNSSNLTVNTGYLHVKPKMKRLAHYTRHFGRRSASKWSSPKSTKGKEDDKEEETLKKLNVLVRQNSLISSPEIERVRESLILLHQSPCEKWKHKKRVNVELIFQLIQVIFVTFLLSLFHGERSSFESFSQTNRLSLHHIFLNDWNVDQEVLPYPPGTGEYALYTQKQLYNHMNFVLYQYYRFEDLTLTSLTSHWDDTVNLTINYITKEDLDPLHRSYDVDSHKAELDKAMQLPRSIKDPNCNETEAAEKCFRVQDYLKQGNHTIEPRRIIDMTLHLLLHGINVEVFDKAAPLPLEVKCVDFRVKIHYDNSKRSGQFLVKLTTVLDMRYCENKTSSSQNTDIEKKNSELKVLATFYDGLVLFICSVTFVIAFKSVIYRCSLMQKTKRLFKDHYGIQLTVPEMTVFLPVWNFQHIFTDILVVIGTSLKIYLKYGHIAYERTFHIEWYYRTAAILLATANLFQWFGLIRYLAFCDKYYILISTITKAIPALVRFLICGAFLFAGYLFAGWILLGPYNPKFESLSATAASLFSLINGDEIYATMSIINYKDHPMEIWVFSWLYLCSYIVLFIFTVVNLFIAVIMESYDTVKGGGGLQKTFLDHFIGDTLKIVGKTNKETQQVFERRDKDEVDSQYGILAPLMCCLDRCVVHHDANTRRRSRKTKDEMVEKKLDDDVIEDDSKL